MSLPKLTSLSTQTLSLLLERQRFQSIPFSTSPLQSSPPQTLHLAQITKNLNQLRTGLLELEQKGSGSEEVVGLLKNQYERMRAMLGTDAVGLGIVGLDTAEPTMSTSARLSSSPLPELAPSQPPLAPRPPPKDTGSFYTPYTDDPEAGYEHGVMLQTQRRIMDDQDTTLDNLSRSIHRQHDVSLQINDELAVHVGLLEELDTEVDHMHSRLGGARRRLDRVAKGARENGSAVTIGLLIFVLLVLIIVFKT